MKRITFTFIILILLSLMLITPVMAYEEIANYTTNQYVRSNLNTYGMMFYQNYEDYGDLGKITIHTHGNVNGAGSGSSSGEVTKCGSFTQMMNAETVCTAGHAADYTASWTAPVGAGGWCGGNWCDDIEITVEFSNLNWTTNAQTAYKFSNGVIYPSGTYDHSSAVDVSLIGSGIQEGHYHLYSGSNVVTPIASFTCAPTSQYRDTSIVCTDESSNTPTDWLWSIDFESAGVNAYQTSTSRNFTWESHYDGTFGVNLRANNSAGSDWENKTSYVHIAGASVNTTNISAPLTLTAVPDEIYLGQTSSLILNGALAGGLNTRVINYYENNNLGAYSTYQLIGSFRYNTSTDNWDYRTSNTASWDFSAHDPEVLVVTPATTGEYNYQAAVFNNLSQSLGLPSTALTILGSGGSDENLIMNLFAYDGGTTNHLSNYDLTLEEVNTAFSQTYENVVYDKDVSLPRGGYYSLTGSKEGYLDRTVYFTVPTDQNIERGDFGAMVGVGLFNIEDTPSAGNTTITIHVSDKETYYPLGNVQITMSGVTTPKFTGTSGESVTFTKPQNTQFTVKAVKEGYCSVQETKNTTTQDYMYVDLYMKYGACAGVTPTHTPIPNATGTPTPTRTPIGGYGQVNGTPAICNQLPVNATFVDSILNSIACAGITDKLTQNLALACLIILGVGLIAGSKVGAIGFAIGAIIGALICIAMGLIPIWFIVILIFLSVAVLSIKIFFSNGG